MRKKFILFILFIVLCTVSVNNVNAIDNAGSDGGQTGGSGSTGGGTSCNAVTDAGKTVDTKTYLFDFVQRKKGSTSFKHMGCVIIGPEAKRATYDTKTHGKCQTITSLGSYSNKTTAAKSLKNIAKYLADGKQASDLNSVIEKNPKFAETWIKEMGIDISSLRLSEKNHTDFGGAYGYRILIQKFIYLGCDSNWKKYVVPRKEAYRDGTGIKKYIGSIIGSSWQGDLYTKQKDIGITKGKKIPSATKTNFVNKNDGSGYNILWFNIKPFTQNYTCEVATENGKKIYYDLCKDANGNFTRDSTKCKTEVKITKGGKDKNGNQLYIVPSLPNNQLTLTQVKNYINTKPGCNEGPKCTYNGNTCYDDAGIKMSTCDTTTKTWIDRNCEKQCWYDSATDAYYEDTSGQGTSITKSEKRNVWDYSCNGSWNGYCSSPYSSTWEGSRTYTLPSPNRECNKTDSPWATNDCTYAKLYSNTKDCYYTTRSCEMVDDYETKTDDKGNKTQVKVGEHEECHTDYHWGPSYTYSTTCNYTGQHKEYYIASEKMWLSAGEANSWVSTCTLTRQFCAFDKSGDGNDDAWYDNNGNYHPDGLTSKIALWINGNCKASKPKATVTCADCNTSTTADGTAFKYTETSVTEQSPSGSYPVLGSYFGGDADNETDLIANHYLKEENGNNEVYCSEELTIKLPNGQTTNLNNAQAGRYITINLESPIENIVNMVPITITTTQTCSAIENKPVTVNEAGSYSSLGSLQNYDSRDALSTYINKKYEDTQNAKRAEGLGGIKLKYDDKEYTINFDDEESELEQFLVKNDLQFSPDRNFATLTQEAEYTLKPDIYQYTSIGDGSVSKIKPSSDKLSSYYNLGNSTLPIRFEEGVTNHVTFVYDYEGTDLESVFEDTSSFPLDTTSKACVNKMTSESEEYYTCELKTSNKCSTITTDDGKIHYYDSTGKEITKIDYDELCLETTSTPSKICKIQKTDDGAGYTYYYYDSNQKKIVSTDQVSIYMQHCSCLEQDGKYYLNGEEIEKEDYTKICPTQCTTVCPAGEICCPTGGADMPCSVDGVCPGSGGNKIVYRTIDLSNPFPGQNTKQDGRRTGNNWCGYNIFKQTYSCNNLNDGTNENNNATNTNSIVYKHIKNNAGASEEDVYRQNPQYSITLNSTTIDSIRNYNKTQKNSGAGGYDDFTLSCYNATSNEIRSNLYANGIYTTSVCRSDFIRNTNIIPQLTGECSGTDFGDLLTCSERSVK